MSRKTAVVKFLAVRVKVVILKL